MSSGASRQPRFLAGSLMLGLVLLALGQVLTLVHYQPFSDYWYGIVWTGFILAADASIGLRTGACLLLQRPRELLRMVALSGGLWWAFELGNATLFDNWSYAPSPEVPHWLQWLRSCYFFATLLPATWVAAGLAAMIMKTRPAQQQPAPRLAVVGLIVGALCGLLAVLLPQLSLPLSLIALGLVADSLNLLLARPSLLGYARRRSLSLLLAISVGNVAAGVLGEAWNYPAHPRWNYDVSYAGDLYLFAMPLPGYLGYAALALDLFALYHLLGPRRKASFPAGHPYAVMGL
jgi:hypothetical protein